MTYLYTSADWKRITRPHRSRCQCGAAVYSRDHHNGWSSWPVFVGMFGEAVSRCQCGRRLSGKLLDIVSYRNFSRERTPKMTKKCYHCKKRLIGPSALWLWVMYRGYERPHCSVACKRETQGKQ